MAAPNLHLGRKAQLGVGAAMPGKRARQQQPRQQHPRPVTWMRAERFAHAPPERDTVGG